MKKNHLIFDVESTSLHGTGFAVGAVVIDGSGNVLDQFSLKSVESEKNADPWVQENVIPHLKNMLTVETTKELRTKFYEFYMKHKETCEVWSDVNFPVETNFLSDIVNDEPHERKWNMPYPLKDISVLIDVNIDRAEYSEIKGLRKHHPLDDAMASAMSLVKFSTRLVEAVGINTDV